MKTVVACQLLIRRLLRFVEILAFQNLLRRDHCRRRSLAYRDWRIVHTLIWLDLSGVVLELSLHFFVIGGWWRSYVTVARLRSNGGAWITQLAALVAETSRLQAVLEARFLEAFENVDTAVDKRQAKRKSLDDDLAFQARNRIVVDAGNAIKDYEHRAALNLAQLETESKAYVDSLKSPRLQGFAGYSRSLGDFG
jgi:hypothetical protein